MHDLLFQHQDELEIEDLVGYAGDLGLDVERFTRDLEDERHVGPYDAVTLAGELRRSFTPQAA